MLQLAVSERRALERLVAESLRGRRRRAAPRTPPTTDVAVEHARVRVVEDRRLDPPAEQRLRLAHEVLVERVLARDEDGGPVPAPPGASPLLPQARDGAREADRDRAVEQPDVDPELERVRRRDAEQLALDEPTLDVAPLRRRVARPGRARARRGRRPERARP